LNDDDDDDDVSVPSKKKSIVKKRVCGKERKEMRGRKVCVIFFF